MIDLTKERQLNLLKEISKCRSIDNNCDYLLEHSDCDDLIDYINYLQQESKELNQKYLNAVADYETTMAEKNELERQQKEFVKYLENCINELKKESMNKLQNAINLGIVDITKEILSKYQEIIGQNNG